MLLNIGSIHPWVGVLQEKLNERGFNLTVDSMFGGNTKDAVQIFQRISGLAPDGIVGKATWSALKSDWLKDNSDALAVPLEPLHLLPVPALSKDLTIASIWNRWGGLLSFLSTKLQVPKAALVSVIAIESGGLSHTDHGPTIRFENHRFWREYGHSNPIWFQSHFTFDNAKPWLGHKFRDKTLTEWEPQHISGLIETTQAHEWKVFNFAAEVNKTAAIKSISIGLPQMMGSNYSIIGYESPEAMLEAFSSDERPQLLGMFDFIIGPEPGSPMLTAIKKLDWETFAHHYNGPGQVSTYSQWLRDRYYRALSLGVR